MIFEEVSLKFVTKYFFATFAYIYNTFF